MAGSFHHFRKHQKVFMAVAAVFCMVIFVFASALKPGQAPTSSGGGKATDLVVSWDGGSINRAELGQLVEARNITDRFLKMLYFASLESPDTPEPRDGIPVFTNIGQEMTTDQLEQEAISAEWVSQLAQENGISVSIDMVNQYLKQWSDGRVSSDSVRGIFARLGGQRGERQMESIVYGTLQKLLLAHYYLGSFNDMAHVSLPAQRWNDWRSLNEQVSVQAVGLNIEDFVDQVSEPNEKELKAYFNQYKDRNPQLVDNLQNTQFDSPEPGFAIPHKVRLHYLRGSLVDWRTKLIDKVSAEEVKAYYEAHKDEEFVAEAEAEVVEVEEVIEVENADSAPVEKSGEKAAADDKESNDKPAEAENAVDETPADKSAGDKSADVEPAGDAADKSSEMSPEKDSPEKDKAKKDTPEKAAPEEPGDSAVPDTKEAGTKEPDTKESDATETEATETEATETEAKAADATETSESEPPAESEDAAESQEKSESNAADDGNAAVSVKTRSPFRLVAFQNEDKAAENEKPASEKPTNEAATVAEAKAGDTKGETPADQTASPEESASSDNKENTEPGPAETTDASNDSSPTNTADAAKQAAPEEEAAADDRYGPKTYEPLEKVEDAIRLKLATKKAAEKLSELMDSAYGDLSIAYNKYSGQLAATEGEEGELKDLPEPPESLVNLQPLAEKYGLISEELDLLSRRELFEVAAVARAREMQGQYRPVGIAEFGEIETYEPLLANDNPMDETEGDWYLVVKTEDQARRIPDFEEAREQVLEAWKRQEAAKLALARAKELSGEFAKSSSSFSDFFTKQDLHVETTDMFTRLTFGVAPNGREIIPRISQAPGLTSAGPEVMDAIFSLEDDKTTAVLNHDHSIAYILKIHRREMSKAEQRQVFLNEANNWQGVQEMMQVSAGQFNNALIKQLRESVDFKIDEKWEAERAKRR